MTNIPKYVIVTPAKNEGDHIGLTLDSVVAQTVRPLKWVIVSDGSTDNTDEIVQKYAAEYPWIEFVRLPERRERHFAGKVLAFNAGYARVKHLDFDVICSLDADISFEADYFSFLLGKLANYSEMGLVGTPFKEEGSPTYDYRFTNIEHVSGACQVFRRKCFEDIGGYVPVKGGSIDHIAVLTARMKGWKTKTFPEKVCIHHRTMGTAQQSVLMARFRYGGKDYAMGNHPAWELCRAVYQMTKSPYVLGGVMLLSGFLWSMLRRVERPITPQLVSFQRREQLERLKKFLLPARALRGVSEHDPNAGAARLEEISK